MVREFFLLYFVRLLTVAYSEELVALKLMKATRVVNGMLVQCNTHTTHAALTQHPRSTHAAPTQHPCSTHAALTQYTQYTQYTHHTAHTTRSTLKPTLNTINNIQTPKNTITFP